MALSNTTLSLLRTQYYDDWYEAAESNSSLLRGDDFDFHRILFRPRYAVQSRELTQIQTILQAQLERFGKSAFRDGEAVLGGQLTLDTAVLSGKVLAATNLVAIFDRTTNSGKYVFDANNTSTRAHVLQYAAADEGYSDNYLVFKYQTATAFSPGTVVQASDDALVTATFASAANSEVFSEASIISIDEGVFFISGFFVRVKPQTIVLNPFSARPSYRIGLEVEEEVLDELDDDVGDTLLDPANQNAPGAHRFRIKLTLGKRTLSSPADASFIELARVVDGIVQQTKKAPRFVRIDELNEILARRTYDESGDYIVRPFTPVVEDDPETEDHFVLSLGPGKAYVHGFEVETTQPTKLAIRKGRVTDNATNRSLPLTVGNYVYVTRVAAEQPLEYFANAATVDLHCVNVASIARATSADYNYSRIGQAKIRTVETFEVPANNALHANNTVYKLFFYDVTYDSLTGNLTTGVVNGSAITVYAPVANGMPNVNGAIEGATIILSGASSPVTGTYTVNNYVVTGANAAITLKEFLPTLPNGNTQYRLLFQARDIDSFAIYDNSLTTIQAPYTANLAFQAEVDQKSKDTLTPIGNTVVFDTHNNLLLYQIPERFVKANTITSNEAIFTAWVQTNANAQAFGAATNANFTLSVSGANYSLPTGNLTASRASDTLVIFDQTADANGRGRALQFSDTPGTGRCLGNVSVTQVGSTYNITFTYFNADAATTRSLTGLARTTVIGLDPRQKTLVVGNTTAVLSNTTGALNAGQIEFHSLNATAGFAYSLKTADVFNIRKVYYKDSNTAFANSDLSTATDVTSYFTLDDGQRDNSYEYSRLIVSSRASSVIRPTGRLLVIFDWFSHSGRGYVTLDSYLSSTNIANGMTYDEIPSYKSAKYNQEVNLRDVIDFRPVRSNYDFTAAALVYAANDESSNTTYLTSDGSTYLAPVSDEEWLGSYQYYLNRYDKVALGFDGVFRVIEGKDAVSPVPPADTAGALLMFQLYIPAYTLVDEDGVPTSVVLTTFDHKRFTMADLSKLDDRVAHLEYYTALNSLERITRDQSILDASGNERFKNGILVDSFHGGDVADVRRLDYTASIDQVNRELRTAFRTFVMGFAPDTANSTSHDVTLIGDMAILSYSTDAFIEQLLATHAVSVNPFDVASFYGTVKLSPAVDIWKDVDQKPAQVVDLGGPSEAWVNANQPSFVQWGEWEQTWSGVSIGRAQRQFFTPPGWTPENHAFRSMTQLSFQDISTATTYERQGTAFEYEVTSTTSSLGNRVIDVSIVHNMRARDIVFSAEGLKPQANLYAFFDGVSVQNYIQQANVLEIEALDGNTSPFYLGQTLYVKKAITGNIATTSGNTSITGTDTVFQYELVTGQLVQIVQGVTTFNRYVANIVSNTSLTLSNTAPNTLAAATLYTLTPVTVADIAARVSGNTTTYTLKVVRANRDADADSAIPYAITAGALRVEKHVNDSANTTTGAQVIIPATPRFQTQYSSNTSLTLNVGSSICKSGVVRAWDSASGALRFDNDILDSAVETPGTTIYFVSGTGVGTSANVVSYTAANQTAILDNSELDLEPGETIYSIGENTADGFLEDGVASGRAGTAAGVFHMQNAQFAVGTRLFRLTDNANNVAADATTAAETNYTASGMSYTQQETSVTSRSLGLRRAGVRTETFTQRTNSTVFDVQYVDPLAQTFLVDKKQYPQGVFITSIELCFAAVPDDDIPVIVELRPVVNGYPSSNEIVPCVAESGLAVASLRPDQVTTTTTPSFDPLLSAQSMTKFTFGAPVHLMPGREYAIVVRSDSAEYQVYTAELGKTVIGSTAVVAKQPYAGSFFKSQNASTWTESPFEDLMFRINRAVWNATEATPLSGVLVARSIAPTSNASFDSFELYPHEVQFSDLTSVSYDLDIKPMNANTGDLTGQIAVRYSAFPNEWQPLSYRSMVQGVSNTASVVDEALRPITFDGGPSIGAANTVDAMVTLTTYSPDVAPFIDTKKFNLLAVRHLINDMDLQSEDVVIVNPGAGYLANLQTGLLTTTAGSPTVTGDANTDFVTTLAVGDTVVIGGNLEVIVSSITNTSTFVATSNVAVTRASNTFWRYGAVDANNAVAVTVSDGNGTDAAGYAVIGSDGKVESVVFEDAGSGYTGTPTISIDAPAAPGGDYTITQTTAVLDYNSELAASDGNALTRYITRPVVLADGFDARDIVVTFDAYRPAGSKFHVYYRVLAGDADTVRFDDQPWRPMEMETPDSTVSTTYYQFKEFRFKTPNSRALDSEADTTDKFKVFAIKLVMASSSTVDVPRVMNFRAIALDA